MATKLIQEKLHDIDYYYLFFMLSGTITAAQLLKYSVSSFKQRRKNQSQDLMYKAIIEKKQSSRSSSLQEITVQNKLQGFSRDKMLKILRQDIQTIVANVKEGNFTIDEVKAAHLMRALDIAVENNYLADIFIEDKQAHRIIENKPKIKLDYLLYGVTYSVADWIEMSGYDSTCGIVSGALKPVGEDAVIIKCLADLQAVPLFRSSVNQSVGSIDNCFTQENANAIWGRAQNPHKREFSTGGGCGGEAGLVATSSIGLGFSIDLYGEGRYPAACCGVCAFKPTSSRMSQIGITSCGLYSPISKPVITPMARSSKDLTYLFKCLWDSQIQLQYDNTVSPLKFQVQQNNPQRLNIGYFVTDGLIDPCQSNKNAIIKIKEILEEQGHTVIEFNMGQKIHEGVLLAYQILCATGKLQEFTSALQGEQPMEEKIKLLEQATLSNMFKSKLISILKELKQDRMSIIMESTMQIHPNHLVELMNKLNHFIRYFTEYWVSMNFDAVISPAGPVPAIPHKMSSELFCLNSYFMLFNILDYPAGVLPVKLVQTEEIKELKGNFPRAKVQNQDRITEFVRLAQMDSQGLPVGIQVAALPNQDEKCLQVMELIERLIGFNDVSFAYIF